MTAYCFKLSFILSRFPGPQGCHFLAVASDPERCLDDADLGRAVEIAETHGFEAQGWIAGRTGIEEGLFALAWR